MDRPRLLATYTDLMDALSQTTCQFDRKTVSATIIACSRQGLNEEAIRLFDALRVLSLEIDWKTVSFAMRAAISLRKTIAVADLLNYTLRNLCQADAQEVLNHALEIAIFLPAGTFEESKLLTAIASSICNWAVTHHFLDCPIALEHYAKCVCRFETDAVVATARSRVFNQVNTPLLKTYTHFLNRYAMGGNKQEALEILDELKRREIPLETSIFNILLKLSAVVKDLAWTKELLMQMKSSGIPADHRTYSLLRGLEFSFRGEEQLEGIRELINNTTAGHNATSSIIYQDKILRSTDVHEASQLFREAYSSGLANDVVYVAFATKLKVNNRTLDSLQVLVQLIRSPAALHIRTVPYFVGTLIGNLRHATPETESKCKRLFTEIVHHLVASHPRYVTKTMKQYLSLDALPLVQHSNDFELSDSEQTQKPAESQQQQQVESFPADPRFAVQFHLHALPEHRIWSVQMRNLFLAIDETMRENSSYLLSNESVWNGRTFGQQLVDLMVRQHSMTKIELDTPSDASTSPIAFKPWSRSFRIANLDTTWKLLEKGGEHDSIMRLFRLVVEDVGLPKHVLQCNNSSKLLEFMQNQSLSTKASDYYSWRPTGTTVHMLSNYFRVHNQTLAAAQLLWWICYDKNNLAPREVVNAILSQLYNAGEKELTVALFERYASIHTAHNLGLLWFSDPVDGALTIDMHGLSRGMAYAIMTMTIKKMKSEELFQDNSCLRIITGKNLKGRPGQERLADEEDISFRLSNEIQSILVEDFYPPIPSSTEPGNPGRLFVQRGDIIV